MIFIIIFILGLCVGSFLNVLIYRELKEEKWLFGRSYCDHCKKQLLWFDNIPLLSYILLKGKCRYCNKKISQQYPLIELLTGIEFVWIYFLVQGNLNFFSKFEGFYSFLILFIWLFLGASFLTIFITDLKYQIIPDTAIIFGVFLSFIKLLVDYRYTGMVDFTALSSGFLTALFFLSLILITKGKGMGFGDVKLGLLIGLVLGYPKTVIALGFGFLTGAFVGVILILSGKKGLKSKIAFGPFLILGTVLALFYTDIILRFFNIFY